MSAARPMSTSLMEKRVGNFGVVVVEDGGERFLGADGVAGDDE